MNDEFDVGEMVPDRLGDGFEVRDMRVGDDAYFS